MTICVAVLDFWYKSELQISGFGTDLSGTREVAGTVEGGKLLYITLCRGLALR